MPPVEPGVERQLLSDQAAQHAADVGGRDVDQVRIGAALGKRVDQPGGSQQVGLSAQVGRVVELDRRRGCDDDVGAQHLVSTGLGQAQAFPAEVELDDSQLLLDECAKGFLAEAFPERLEGRAGEHLLLQAVGRRAALAGADGEVDAAHFGHRAEELLDDRLSEEARRPGDEQRLTGEAFGYQGDQF